MKALFPLIALLFVVFEPRVAKAAESGNNLLATALQLRMNSIAPVVIDPDVLDLKLLTTDIRIEAKDRSSAVAQLKSQLEPWGLSVYDQDGIVWVTKRDAEADLSREIALVVNSKNYQQLAGALAGQARTNSDPRLAKLAEMAKFMADQSKIPGETRELIEEKTKKIKSLQFMQKNAITGSSLTPPDPARAAGLELDIDKERNEVREYYDKLKDQFLSSAFDANDPASAPPAIYATQELLPLVLYNRIALDSELFYVESMDLLLRAGTSLAFDKTDTDQKKAAELRSRIDGIKRDQADNKKLLGEYMNLLERAGLVSGVANQKSLASSGLGVEAANKLFNDFGDQREAVRVAIGQNIIGQLEVLTRSLRGGKANFISATDPKELYLFGSQEIATANEHLGAPIRLEPYSPAEHQRIGAVTGLSVKGSLGQTSVRSVQLEPLPKGVSSARSIGNIFGSKDQVVAINTTADVAKFGDMLLTKDGSVNTSLSSYFGSDGFIGSIGEALGLIRNEYDPAIFKSKVVVQLDGNFDIMHTGDSAGLSIALAALSRIKSRPVDNRVMVTGAVRQFGDVRSVGAVYLKGIAAMDAGALCLLVPVSTLDQVFNLPSAKVLTRHVIALQQFREAAGIARVDVTEKDQPSLEAICLYNFALAALTVGKLPEAAALCRLSVDAYPEHVSAQLLKASLAAAAIAPAPAGSISGLANRAKSFANQMTTDQIIISGGGSAGSDTGTQDGVMAAIIPNFTVADITVEEAFMQLNDRAKAASGQSPNINIRKKNPYFTNIANLSIQNKTVLEILKELCELSDAKFERRGSAIVVDSLQSPIPADVSALVIPDYTVSNTNPEDAFKLLATKAEEVSGKKVNITIESHENIWTDLAITLSMQRKTFKEVIDQLCAICDATVEQRGDSFVVKVIK